MTIPFSLIEVFNDPARGFKGNISSVLLLDAALSDGDFQSIALDLNQPATTFLWPSSELNSYNIRWFAPDAEIGLCGHGSLAAISYLAKVVGLTGEIELRFPTGQIKGAVAGGHEAYIIIDPIPVLSEKAIPEALAQGLGVPVKGFFTTENKQIVLLEDEETLKNMKPDFARLRESKIFGYSVTAPGNDVDFVSRTLVPHVQQLEDHATGSSHAALAPFWAKRLGKAKLSALQLSPRGGKFTCEVSSGGVKLTGSFSTLARGHWLLEPLAFHSQT